MGGECNYLLRLSPATKELEFVPDHEWKTPCMQSWQDADIKYVLREAEKLLLDTAYQLRLPVKVTSIAPTPSSPPPHPTQSTLPFMLMRGICCKGGDFYLVLLHMLEVA